MDSVACYPGDLIHNLLGYSHVLGTASCPCNQVIEENLQDQVDDVVGATILSGCGQDDSSEACHKEDTYDIKVPFKARRNLAQNNPTDQNGLLSFKQAITKDPNGTLRGWNASVNSDYCLWKGVICNTRTKRVIAINITGTRHFL